MLVVAAIAKKNKTLSLIVGTTLFIVKIFIQFSRMQFNSRMLVASVARYAGDMRYYVSTIQSLTFNFLSLKSELYAISQL